MVRHIILWKFLPSLDEGRRAAETARLTDAFRSLKGRIPGLVDIEFARNFNPDNDYDAALFSTFTCKEALDAYQTHPAHVEVKNTIPGCLGSRACVDYEI